MEIIRGLHNIKPAHRGCVVTIGNFDGLHLGHHQLLKTVLNEAKKQQLSSMVILFEPQANEFFFSGKEKPRLMRFREKIHGLKKMGIDSVLCIHFNENFTHLTAQDFIEKILLNKLGIKLLIVGDDFHFGYQRKGNIALLKEYVRDNQFQVIEKTSFEIDNERVSSSYIRNLLQQGNLSRAVKFLGHPFSLCGRVVSGHKRGRILGFPTANIYLHRKASPLLGVFAVEMIGINDFPLQGVANIGTRPTIAGDTKIILEVHLFNFDKDIYSKEVEVRFMGKLREEKKFDSLDLLQQQIRQDVQEAKIFFASIKE